MLGVSNFLTEKFAHGRFRRRGWFGETGSGGAPFVIRGMAEIVQIYTSRPKIRNKIQHKPFQHHRIIEGRSIWDLNTALHSLDDHAWSVKGHDARLWAKRGHNLIPHGSNRVSYEQGVQVAWTVSAFHSLHSSLLI